MKITKEGHLPSMSGWHLESARLIAFSSDPPFFLDQHWWQDLVSDQPDDFVSIRKKHTREERGSFRGVILSLNVDLSRVEWLIQPAVEVDESSRNLPTIGPFREKVNWFVDLLDSWLAASPLPVVRLAFAGKLLRAAATQQEAYQVLGAYLPAVKLDPNPNDFLFQINRRKYSAVVPGLPINRLSAWSKINGAFARFIRRITV